MIFGRRFVYFQVMKEQTQNVETINIGYISCQKPTIQRIVISVAF